LTSNPQPNDFGVKRRGSLGFHQRCFTRSTVGRRQSYGTPRNFPVFVTTGSLRAQPAAAELGVQLVQSVDRVVEVLARHRLA